MSTAATTDTTIGKIPNSIDEETENKGFGRLTRANGLPAPVSFRWVDATLRAKPPPPFFCRFR